MLRVLINQATEGMRLAMPVLHPRRGNVLLREGFVLDMRLINKLRELDVHEFWIDYPGAEQIKRFLSPVLVHKQARLATMLSDTFERVQTAGAGAPVKMEFGDYRRAMRDLIEELIADPLASSYIVEMAGGAKNVLRHCSEVSFLSVALGLKLQDYLIAQRPRLGSRQARNVVSLGVGALVHDVGYLRLVHEVIDRRWKSGDDSDPQWQTHVGLGYRMLTGGVQPSAAAVVLQHHQHFDGSGFPKEVERRMIGPHSAAARAGGVLPAARGLKGEEIHVFARIACVANHFDRLRRPPGGQVQPRVRVLRRLLFGPLRSRFDPVVLAALPRVVPAYQPGSLVRLSTGERAIVTDWDPAQPCRPRVQVVVDAMQPAGTNKCIDGPAYDLREHPDLVVVEHEGVDVREDNFALPSGRAQAA